MKVCVRCGTTKELSVDHIIPQHLFRIADKYGIELPFGKDDPRNQQWMCAAHNSRKANSIDTDIGFSFLDIVKEGFETFEAKGGYVCARDRRIFRFARPTTHNQKKGVLLWR